jgi:hypothetical protein
VEESRVLVAKCTGFELSLALACGRNGVDW